jgi:alpha-glucosidase
VVADAGGLGPVDAGRSGRQPGSTWAVLRRALEVRREVFAAAGDEVEWLPSPPGTLVVRRGRVVVVLNASVRAWPLGRLVPGGADWVVTASSGPLSNGDDDVVVPPATSRTRTNSVLNGSPGS